MSTATVPQGQAADQFFQVSGAKEFEGHRWREAILYYLNGVWSDNNDVTYRPKIKFTKDGGSVLDYNVTLRLDQSTGEYYAYGTYEGVPFCKIPDDLAKPEGCLRVGKDQNAVEMGLIRFVRNDAIRALQISFGPDAGIVLWKTSRRGELWIAIAGLPRHLGEVR